MIEVISGGLYSSIQDLGRRGWRQLGFARSGAMDPLAAQAANALLNQDGNLAVIEATLIGPSLRFHCDSAVAITGATMTITIDSAAVEPGQVHAIKAGQTLTLGRAKHGCRSYLAIKGGIDTEPVLGSVSHQSQLGLGQQLSVGDTYAIRPYRQPVPICHSWVGLVWPLTPVLGCFASAQTDRLEHGLTSLCQAPWQVSPQGNRLGLRLCGDPLSYQPATMASEPVLPGTVQLPSNGQPIILGADCQSVGGYPKIAQVAESSLTTLGQLRPNQQLWFEAISLTEARARLKRQHRHLRQLRLSAQQRWQQLEPNQ
ncbi:biotin-dependent carboxyltransferase family protein [Ferrimonas senticii]|uniref:5-oxoprolinase subunit C family protein n=1 Tax=Ferrimonas senticii TaxID=394566 RepID=UPI000416A9E9|nr:biotin-dependent carboxyltransferase family protein [Ferrimonas senticii]